MPLVILIEALKDAAKYGPDVVAAGKQIIAAVRAGPHPLTPADIALLDSFDKTAAQYLADAGGAPATG